MLATNGVLLPSKRTKGFALCEYISRSPAPSLTSILSASTFQLSPPIPPPNVVMKLMLLILLSATSGFSLTDTVSV